jgi:hypothetical protein
VYVRSCPQRSDGGFAKTRVGIEATINEEVFEQTGQVTWSFSRFDEGEWQENIAEPRTERWLWFVVANILYPMGYQADLGIGEDG